MKPLLFLAALLFGLSALPGCEGVRVGLATSGALQLVQPLWRGTPGQP